MQPGAWRASPRRPGCGATKDGTLNVLSSFLFTASSLTICFDSRMRAEQLTTTVPTSGAVDFAVSPIYFVSPVEELSLLSLLNPCATNRCESVGLGRIC